MTDKEIIKAFNIVVECEGKDAVFANVNIKKEASCECKHIALTFGDILDLINRQQAEIERLLQKLQQPQSEAIKEFAKRLKDEASEKVGIDEDFLYYDFDDEFETFDSVADVIKFLSAIVIKEMVGEQE